MPMLTPLLLGVGLALAVVIYFAAARPRARVALALAAAGFTTVSWLALRASQDRVDAWTARRNWHCGNVARHLYLIPSTAEFRFDDAKADLKSTLMHGFHSDLLFCLPRDAVDACSDAAWAALKAESVDQLRGQLAPVVDAIETGGECREPGQSRR